MILELLVLNIIIDYTNYLMTSTFKNRIPKRKYRERVQPEAREHLGLLEKKKDYKVRAKNYHDKQDMINNLKLKASTKNEDEFYFKMLKGKKNQDGVHVQQQEDSDFDEQQFRRAMKTQNYTIVNHQRSIVRNKIDKLRASLQLVTEKKQNNHKIFVDNAQQLDNFKPQQYFKTSKQLLQNKILQINPNQMKNQQMHSQQQGTTLKNKYNKLADYLKKQQTLTKLLLKIGYQKNLLGKQRKIIKKDKNGKKFHKFFMERKK